MARTHSAGTIRVQDDGVVLGKGGVPIPTTPTRGVPTLHPHGDALPAAPVQHMDGGGIVSPPPQAAVSHVFLCDKTTWHRNMDGYQAMHLLTLMLPDMLTVTLTHTDLMKIPADVRLHFRKVAVPVREDADSE